MYKAYKFRMYLMNNQKAYDMCKELKELVVEYPFLKEVDSCSLRNSIFNLEDSYKGNNYSNIKIDLKNKKIKYK